jgi:hypothetical protein
LRILKAIVAGIGFTACLFSLGCGTNVVEPLAAPSISTVLPQTITAGSSAVTLKVVGTNFTQNAVILWNGSKLTTSMVDANTLSGSIQGGSIAVPGTAQLQVQNSQTGQSSQIVPVSIVSSGTNVALPLQISPTTLPSGVLGAPYNEGFSVTGGTPSYIWSITSGSLPSGLTLVTGSGLISGTPTVSGTFNFTVTVTDSSSPIQTQSANLSITIAPTPLMIATPPLASGTNGVAYSQALQASGGTPSYTWSIASGSLPAGLTLAAGSGVISGTPTASGTSNFTVAVSDSGTPAQIKSAPMSIAIAPTQLTITTSTLASGTDGVAYSQSLKASEGTPAYTWSITSGNLPAGLTLAAGSGVISGTPTASGTSNFTITVSDSSIPVQTKSAPMSITIAPTQLTITTSTLASGTDGTAYSQTLKASGGSPSYTWSIASGSLPAGLTLAQGSGLISGTPTASVTSNFTVTVSDSSSPIQTKSVAMSITIASTQLAIITSTLASGTDNVAYSQNLKASGGAPSYSWSITSGALPAGLTLATGSGVISGTPIANGTFTFTVNVTDSSSPVQTKSANLSITIAPTPLTIAASTLESATDGTAYSETLHASGGTPEYIWSITSGSLPAGLTLGATTGEISGTPTASGIFTFVVTVTDSSDPQQTQSTTMKITVAPAPASAGTTWYIRLDGGTNTQCTGTTNAPYPGTGVNQPCAYNHPYQMLTYSGTWAALTPGDTIQFLDQGPYYMGEQNAGIGTDWHTQLGGICPAASSGIAPNCVLPAFPNNVTVLGANAGSCHNSTHTGLVNPTVLSGIDDAFWGLNLQGTNGVTVSCIEVTQPDTCTTSGTGAGQCVGGTNNYVGGGGGGGIIFEYGSSAQGPSNLTLQDVAVIGIASSGILGSHVNTLSTDVTTASDVYIIGNGNAGWNGDGGGCTTNCESVGTMNLSYLDVDWNGCVAAKPYNMNVPSNENAYNYCYDDSNEGYGDGFVQIAAGNLTLNVTHSHFRWNTQDGFDSLHLSDDLTHSPSVNISDSWSEGNEGQTFKLGAGSASSAINNVSISNCRIMGTAGNFPLNPSGWDSGLSDFCRAAGDEWAFQLDNGTAITLENNTSVGYGTTMYDFECAYGAPNCGSNGATVVFVNNISKGYPDPGNSDILASGLYFGGGNLLANPGSVITNNLWNTMATGCPSSATAQYEKNYVCADPLLSAESNINAITPTLTSASPAIGAGVAIIGMTTDFSDSTRPIPPAIGAFEF